MTGSMQVESGAVPAGSREPRKSPERARLAASLEERSRGQGGGWSSGSRGQMESQPQ